MSETLGHLKAAVLLPWIPADAGFAGTADRPASNGRQAKRGALLVKRAFQAAAYLRRARNPATARGGKPQNKNDCLA